MIKVQTLYVYVCVCMYVIIHDLHAQFRSHVLFTWGGGVIVVQTCFVFHSLVEVYSEQSGQCDLKLFQARI